MHNFSPLDHFILRGPFTSAGSVCQLACYPHFASTRFPSSWDILPSSRFLKKRHLPWKTFKLPREKTFSFFSARIITRMFSFASKYYYVSYLWWKYMMREDVYLKTQCMKIVEQDKKGHFFENIAFIKTNQIQITHISIVSEFVRVECEFLDVFSNCLFEWMSFHNIHIWKAFPLCEW